MRFPNPGQQAAQQAAQNAQRAAQNAHRMAQNAHRMAQQAHQQQRFHTMPTGTRQSAGGCSTLVFLVFFLIVVAFIVYVLLNMAQFSL